MKKILICGDVDSGKSTLIGRLLKDYNKELYKDISKDELHLITDTLSSEAKSNKTIHSSQYYLNDEVLLINCPGHREYIKDTISRMSEADVAILVKNNNTYKSELTLLYQEMLEMFYIPYVTLYNVDNSYSFLDDISNFTLDIVNDKLDFMIEDVLKLKCTRKKYITSRLNTIIFGKFNYVKCIGHKEKLKLRLFDIVYKNDIITRYNVDPCMPSGSKILFYNNKKIVGCGIYG